MLLVLGLLPLACAWTHPGVFVGTQQLAFVKSQVAAGADPITAAYNKAIASPLAAKDYVPHGPPVGGTIECGSYSKPDHGCSEEDEDGAAAYLQAALFAITSDAQYAANSVAILNAYGTNLKRYNNSNAPLQSAWGASKWARAAELARYTPGFGWAEVDSATFAAMLRRVVLPHIINGSKANGNWELSMIEALFGIAVFTEDSALLLQAQLMWTQRVASYFYDTDLDGDKQPPFPPGRQGSTTWYNQVRAWRCSINEAMRIGAAVSTSPSKALKTSASRCHCNVLPTRQRTDCVQRINYRRSSGDVS